MASGIGVANRAKAELKEINGKCGNNNKYTQWYSKNVNSIGETHWWSGDFVTYVERQCGVPESVVPSFTLCDECIFFAREAGRLYTKEQIIRGAYTPQPGDIFLTSEHTGFVVSVSGNQFTTVEGNIGGEINNRTVGTNTWSFAGGSYDYIFNPEYADKTDRLITVSNSGNEEYMYSENSYTEEKKKASVIWNNRAKENINPSLQNVMPIEHSVGLALYIGGIDILKFVANLGWKNSIYELATTMSFEVAKTDAAYLKDLIHTPQIGDVVQLFTNTEIYRGIIIKVDDGDKNRNKYTVVDMGWYLNKTSQTYQFKNITASAAIKEICADLSINIVMLPELITKINKIYFDKTIADIIKDVLAQCGNNYNYDFVPEGLRIYEIGLLTAYPEFNIANNVASEYSPKYRSGVSHSLSVEEMINSIKITSEKDNVYKEVKVVQNRGLIDKYGFLQKVVKIDPEKENADVVAKRELAAGAGIKESFSFEIIEKNDSYTRAGEVITVDDVLYMIESTDHSYKKGWHFNKLQLKRVS